MRSDGSSYNAWRLLPVDVVFAGVAAGLWSVKHEIQREGFCLSVFIPKKHQRKLQPEGPIPGRKLVRKMLLKCFLWYKKHSSKENYSDSIPGRNQVHPSKELK